MIEYPKVIDCGGMNVTVQDADDEARWRARPVEEPAPIVAEPDAVAEVAAEVPADAPADEPKKKAKTPKKK